MKPSSSIQAAALICYELLSRNVVYMSSRSRKHKSRIPHTRLMQIMVSIQETNTMEGSQQHSSRRQQQHSAARLR